MPQYFSFRLEACWDFLGKYFIYMLRTNNWTKSYTEGKKTKWKHQQNSWICLLGFQILVLIWTIIQFQHLVPICIVWIIVDLSHMLFIQKGEENNVLCVGVHFCLMIKGICSLLCGMLPKLFCRVKLHNSDCWFFLFLFFILIMDSNSRWFSNIQSPK